MTEPVPPRKPHRRSVLAALTGAPFMSREPEIRATLERYAAAWSAGDLAAVTACYHEGFSLHYFGANALTGDHVGKAAVLTTLAEFTRRTGRRLLQVEAIAAGPERGMLISRESLGPEGLEVRRVLVFAVEDSLLKDCWVYDQDQTLIDRLIGA